MASAAGVSQATVSLVLNGQPGPAEATATRVLATAGQLGWVPSRSARALSRSRSDAVGMILARDPDLLGADPFFAQFLAGVEAVLARTSMALLLQVVTPGDESAAYERLASSESVDGVFLLDLGVDDPRPGLVRRLGIAAVQIGNRPGPGPLPGVWVDDRPAIAAFVDELVALGHRDIAHVSGPLTFVHASDRRDAFVRRVAAHGLGNCQIVAGDFSAASGASATVHLLDSSNPPTAIVYANDLMAIAGMGVLHSRGIRVPDDMSITGFDDIELAAHLHCPLTTARSDVVAWGRRAAEQLLAVVHGTDVDDVVLGDAVVVRRHSVAPPRGGTGSPDR